MKILGINTATNDLSIAVIDDDKVLGQRTEQGPTARAEQLIPWIANLLNNIKLTPKDLDGIGVAQGPGAFTGLRIGVTTAKTLAQMLDIPLAGISTILAYADQCKNVPGAKRIRVVLKACRGECNTGIFQYSKHSLTQIEPDHPEKEEELWQKVRAENSALVGDIPPEFAERTLTVRPDAISIARLALERIRKKLVDDPTVLVPVYSHGANIRLSPRIHGKLLQQRRSSAHGN
jgi:tRNA threonylcarbamoyladenosine biosynthesis protein TsaB